MKRQYSISWIKVFLAATFMLHSFPDSGRATDITVVTENWPPFQEVINGCVDGVATQIVRAVLEEADLTASFGIYPWARAYISHDLKIVSLYYR
jgi:hypothetical protein